MNNNIIYVVTQKRNCGDDGSISTGLPISNRLVLGAYDNDNGAYILIPFVYNGIWHLKAVLYKNLQTIQNVEISYSLIIKEING